MAMLNTDNLNRTVFISDNLPFLQALDTESVDLVIIDPPFGKNQTFTGQLRPPLTDAELEHEYDLLAEWGVQNEDDAYDAGIEFPDQIGTTAQFSDIWDFRYQVTETDWEMLDDVCRAARLLIEATRYTHSESTAAYISFMTMRMLEVRRVLKPNGSVYLHCDHEANAYLRQMMDAVFGAVHFQNEIIWHYRRWTGTAKRFQQLHDTLLFYDKGEAEHTFNVQYDSYTEKSLKRKQNYHTRIKNGEVYVTDINEHGVRAGDVWQIPVLNSQARERTGYPTQKPQALARRIIEASSNPGDVVLDCFAGCAYVPVAAELTGRRWIACDMSPRAWTVVRRQFHKQRDLRIITEGEYSERDTGVQPDLGPEVIIRVRGPRELPQRTTNGAQQRLGLRDPPPIRFRQHPVEPSQEIWAVFVKEWGTACWYCGQTKAEDRRELPLDHVEPNARDGSNDDCWNRALSCAPCNSDKSNRLTPAETIDLAFESGRIATSALRAEQSGAFARRREWAQERWEQIRPHRLPI